LTISVNVVSLGTLIAGTTSGVFVGTMDSACLAEKREQFPFCTHADGKMAGRYNPIIRASHAAGAETNDEKWKCRNSADDIQCTDPIHRKETTDRSRDRESTEMDEMLSRFLAVVIFGPSATTKVSK
jgi:hypothetical protein